MKLILALTVFLTACSTTAIQAPAASGASIVITRDSGFFGGGCKHVIHLDDKELGVLEPGEHLVTKVQPGEYTISTTSTGALCPSIQLTQTAVVKDKPVKFRISTSNNFQVTFNKVP